MTEPDVDEDGMIAAYDLIRRAGAGSVEVGYLHDDVPVQEADWWANAQFRGVRITVEHRAGPVEAVEALARRLINGATCTYCRHIITISGQPRDGICRWTRHGNRWVRGCTGTHPERTIRVKGPR